jgi:inorganic pyrophosphatase
MPGTRLRRIRNDRLLAVPVASRRAGSLASVEDLPSRIRDELAHFTIATTVLEHKDATILGWEGPSAAVGWLESLSARSGR